MDRQSKVALGLLVFLGLALGLCGLKTGIPGRERLNVLPDGAPLTDAQAQEMAGKWESLYQKIKVSHRDLEAEPVTAALRRVDIAPGWQTAPDSLVDSCRSFLLQSLNTDEKKSFIILAQMRPWKLNFEPLYVEYGGAFIYPLGATLALAAAVRAAVLTSNVAHYLQIPGDMGRLYLLGRLYVLIFSLGLLAVIFFLGREIRGEALGFASAALFALTPLWIVYAHLVKPHAMAAFWAVACAWFLARACARGGAKDYTLSGACAGLAAGASLTFVSCACWPLLSWLVRLTEGRSEKKEWRMALGAAVLAGFVCAAFNPFLVARPRDFLWEFAVYGRGAAELWSALGGEAPSFAIAAAQCLGSILAALGALGIVSALLRGGARRFLALCVILSSAVVWIKLGRLNEFRLYYPMAALSVVLAVDFLFSAPRWLGVVALCLALIDTGARGLAQSENIILGGTRRATRVEAADWIESHVPEGSALGLLRYPEPAHTPPFRFNRYRLAVLPGPLDWRTKNSPRFAVVDAEGFSAIKEWGVRDYVVAAQFLPQCAPWARSDRDPTYFNTGFYVLERRKSPYFIRQ